MMETIYSDGKTLEIEQKLKCTVFLPQLCYFCGEEITTFEPYKSESLIFHSLDGDHDNWEPSNKRPAHFGCHGKHHSTGKYTSEETRQKLRDGKLGDKNPMKRPEVPAKAWKTKHDRYTPEEISEIGVRGWITRRDRFPPSGFKDLKAFGRAISEGMMKKSPEERSEAAKKSAKTSQKRHGPTGKRDPEAWKKAIKDSWKTRRKQYGPTGRRPKEMKK